MGTVAEKVDRKVGFLLYPQRLEEGYPIINLLQIFKTNGVFNNKLTEISPSEIRKNYPVLDKNIRDLVLRFGPDSMADTMQAIDQLLQNSPGKQKKKQLVIKHLHQQFQSIKPFVNLFKWYHSTSLDGKNYRTAPCHFSKHIPRLKFQLYRKGSAVGIHTIIVINDVPYPLADFNRFHFLLESRNEYFLLSNNDYQCLDWLASLDIPSISTGEAAFTEQVLARLEADYPVDRNNVLNKTQLTSLPINRVLLSELNNAFLMITPQWLYEGFLVEGPFKEKHETTVSGVAYEINRNKETEDKLVQTLLALHPNFEKQKNGYYYLSFADAQKKQWFLKAFHKLLDLGIEVAGIDMLQHFRYSSSKPETTVKVKKQEGSRVELEVRVYFGKEEIPMNLLQKVLLAGQKAILLKDGSLGILGEEWMQQYAAFIKHGKVNKQTVDIAKFMAFTETSIEGNEERILPVIKQQWWQKWKQWQSSPEEVYAVPSTVNATLRPYQQKGFEWMTLLAEAGAGGCLADDMGLGKTLQTICFLAYHIEQNGEGKNIIVCPSSLIYNWQKELEKFAPSISTLVYHGANRNKAQLEEDFQVIITSYGTIRSDAEALLQKEYAIAVIDESHNIKNPTAQITSVVTNLNAVSKIALSGTPVVNNTFDLYSQLNYALPGMFGSREFFKREYADAIDRYQDEEKIQLLQKLTAPFILRRTKEQVAKDLPEKTESILWCKMNARQQELYNEIKDQVRSNVLTDINTNGLNKSKLAVLQGMMKLRQVCNSTALLPVEEQQGINESVKTEVLMQEVKNIVGAHKALVFSQFTSMLDLLAQECDKNGISYYHFDGQTPPAKRAEMVAAFQDKDNDVNLFLISLKAGNSGLTLTAADYVFLFDPWWNTAVEQQAVDRTHRIGQTKNVFAYKMICKDTIEEKIIQLQQKKKKLADELVSEDDGFIRSLSEDDIAYLFS